MTSTRYCYIIEIDEITKYELVVFFMSLAQIG